MSFVSAGPLCRWIRPGDELRYRLARRAPGGLIQGVEIFPDGSSRPGDGLPVNIVRPGGRALLVGIGGNQAGIDRKSGSLDQPFCQAAPDHRLEQLSEQIAIPEAAMPILREARVIRHLAVETEPTEPAVSEVQVNLLAQPPFRANAVAVANQQHPDKQFGIDRRPAGRAVKCRQVAPNVRQIDKTVDRPQQVGGRNVSLKGELVEQRRLINLPRTHHRFQSPAHRTE